jgi:hypothetical protein
LRGSPLQESSHPERVPIKRNHLIDKDALNLKELERLRTGSKA